MGLRKPLLFAIVVGSLALAGCANPPGSQTMTVEPTTPSTTTATQQTISPAEVSDYEAKERALRAEEAYLSAHLKNASCLESWGTVPTTVSKKATVRNRTAKGVIVDVTHPYFYATGETHADLGSNARYLVTETGTTRVSGEEIAPC